MKNNFVKDASIETLMMLAAAGFEMPIEDGQIKEVRSAEEA